MLFRSSSVKVSGALSSRSIFDWADAGSASVERVNVCEFSEEMDCWAELVSAIVEIVDSQGVLAVELIDCVAELVSAWVLMLACHGVVAVALIAEAAGAVSA